MGNVAKPIYVNVREAFKHEAHNFTIWLESNIDALADRLGLKLTVKAREHQVKDFKLDLLCEDESGNAVIIENQLERTDHDHLGKVLTYLVNLEAKVAIWITPEPRIEHIQVMNWLNENTEAGTSFYLVRVEAIRIGDSPYAPLFTPIIMPDEQTKATGDLKKELANEKEEANRQQLRLEFWTQLIEHSKRKTALFANRKPSKAHWFAIGAGKSGLMFNLSILQQGALVELYIDSNDAKTIFDALLQHKEAIEAGFGEPLDWRRLDQKNASRIVKKIDYSGLRQTDTWQALQDTMIAAMIRLEDVFRPYIAALK